MQGARTHALRRCGSDIRERSVRPLSFFTVLFAY